MEPNTVRKESRLVVAACPKMEEDNNHKAHKGQYISATCVVAPIVDVLVEH